ncbi:MAG: methyltransferase domain-containing protein [Candidatus Rokubacteria bacterium]|nr:methyltransferase domain-containing protein [Candidatus Rokubacteria bacterium]
MTDAISYYDDHPISEAHVWAAVRARTGGFDARLRAEDLFDFDQDHYGGLSAVDALATRAALGPGMRVLDLCAGLAGPARFIASRRGCRVVALELHAGRAAGAARLTRAVGLERLVRIVRGDARRLPFRRARFDACISEEALLHIEDKAAVLADVRRVLVPGGRLAFTDWIAHPRLADRERARLRDWMAATTVQTLDGYRTLLGRAGFGAIEAEDLSDEWRRVVRDRIQRLAARRDEVAQRALHAFFLGLIEQGKLGGGRFTAVS